MSEIHTNLISAFLVLFIAPLLGGILIGLDRRISARFQNRIGPPLLQPFYDLIKLFAKEKMASNRIQAMSVFFYLVSVIMSLFLLISQSDMLVMVFVLAMGSVSFVLGGFSVKSPYNYLGSQREVIQLLSYEPLLIFYVVAIFVKTGSFLVPSVYRLDTPLFYIMPVFYLAMIVIMVIKLRKSPFDISMSHHGHQEIVKGITTELSGRYLAVVELTHWYELILLLYLTSLLWGRNILMGIVGALLAYFATIIIDNITARLTWRHLLRFTWRYCLPAVILNLAYIYISRGDI